MTAPPGPEPAATASSVTFLNLPQLTLTARPEVHLRTWANGSHTVIIRLGQDPALTVHVSDPACAEAHAAAWAQAARLLREAQGGTP